uniref:interleukin-1 beta n=1 Tax=Scatophagus argus TaxID=75038 RepID=UPI001ED7F56C|nr:interleukin-1 beta [Scatophagus argus]
MNDFDLSQALDGSDNLDETRFEPRCCNMTDVKDKIFRLDEGLDLVLSCNPITMQSVANLLLAVNRMKKSLRRSDRKLGDDELCYVIMDSLVNETIVKTTENFSTGEKRNKFVRANSAKLCNLCDMLQKDVVHGPEEHKLQAITLTGGQAERKVNFKLSRYMGVCASSDKGQTVVLSIANSKWHISCSMKDGRAVLNLEECSDEQLQTISDSENMDRFLFYKRTTGKSLTTFESVKCCGWFISTSYEDENQPVEMCQADAVGRLATFKLT